jgi:hypothetical protein
MPNWAAPGAPLASAAFQPHSLVVLNELFDNQWLPWEINFPACAFGRARSLTRWGLF